MLPHLQELLKRIVPSECTHRDNESNQTILQAIEILNIDVECLCREGVCGTCETAILDLASTTVNASPSSGTVEANCSQ
jgi:ferredoxin